MAKTKSGIMRVVRRLMSKGFTEEDAMKKATAKFIKKQERIVKK